ncbi:MAG: hypothetical protein ABJP45_11700 [Cyclobacteriaceae bacterium]
MEDDNKVIKGSDPDIEKLLRSLKFIWDIYLQSSKEIKDDILKTILTEFAEKKELQMVEIMKTFQVEHVEYNRKSGSAIPSSSVKFERRGDRLRNCISLEKELLKLYDETLAKKIEEVQKFILNNHKQDNIRQVQKFESFLTA